VLEHVVRVPAVAEVEANVLRLGRAGRALDMPLLSTTNETDASAPPSGKNARA
jgi:hypothetical protein